MATIQIRRATAATAASNNVTLAQGEMGYETDTGRTKFGDGSTAYNSLPYTNVKNNDSATVPPAVTDDSASGYSVRSIWSDVTGNKTYICIDASVGAAVWIDMTAGSGITAVVEDTSPQLGGDLDTNGHQVQWSKGADVASASALPIGTDGNYYDVTGNDTITSINTTGKVGTPIKLHFDAILILTHHATDLILPTGANITTQAGDEVEFLEYAAGDFRCTSYLRADGTALVGASSTATITTDTSTTISLANPLGNYCNMGSANATTTYTTTGAVNGGWAIVFVNAASEPTITGATKEHGNVFYASTDMYMRVYYDGTTAKYCFLRKDVLNNADNLQKEITDNYVLTSADNGYLIKCNAATAKNITVNNDLSDNFECTFWCKGAGSWTFLEGTAVFDDFYGTILETKKTCYLFKDAAANSYVLTGNLTT